MKNLIILLIIISYTLGYSQNQAPPNLYELPQITSPAPDMASLGKFGDIPVGHYTGIPSINIPLYELQTKSGYKLPISLDYHALGTQVNEKATRVGLGWSFNYGGIITQTVYGLNDGIGLDHPLGKKIPHIGSFSPSFVQNNDNHDHVYAKNVVKTGLFDNCEGTETGLVRQYHPNFTPSDSKPDIFNYTFPGENGKFIFDQSGNIHTIPYSPIKILKNSNGIEYTIINTDGTKYIYSKVGLNITSNTSCSISYDNHPFDNSNFSWKLSKIITVTNEEINFTYVGRTYEYYTSKIEYDSQIYPGWYGATPIPHTTCMHKSKFSEYTIKNISYKNVSIDFIYSDDPNYKINGSNTRKDFPGNPALRLIQVNHKTGTTTTPIKKLELKYDYFVSTISQSTQEDDNYRLKLTEIIENDSHKKHQFIYDETFPLPARFSNGQDLWGYSNGQYSQQTGLSEMVFFGNRISGANRKINSQYAQNGILKKIIYPTKGSTSFEYESNKYFSDTEVQYLDKTYQFPTASNPVSPQNHTFTITDKNKYGLKVNIVNDCGNTGTEFNTKMCIVKIIKDGVVRGTYTTTGTYPITYSSTEGGNGLTLGDWTMEYTKIGDCNCTVGLSWIEEETLPPGDFLAGGLRIKTITDDDGRGNQYSTTYDYLDPNTGKSSGYLHDKIFYNEKRYTETAKDQTDISQYKLTKLNVRNNSNVLSFGRAQGAPVGYSKVTEKKSGTNNYGKIVYEYTNFGDGRNVTTGKTGQLTAAISRQMTPTIYSWKRGLLLKKSIYNKNNSLVQTIENEYEYDNQKAALSSDYYGQDRVSGGLDIYLATSSNAYYGACHDKRFSGFWPAQFYWGSYYITSAWIKLKKEKKTSYVGGESLVATTDYFYDNPAHAQLTRSETNTSTDRTIITKTFYPDDILATNSLTNGGALSSTDFNVISKLKSGDLFRISTPIQIETSEKRSNGTITLLGIERHLFKEENNLVLPGIIQQAKGTDNINNRVEYHKYDSNGNPLELSISGGTKISYIWGHDKTLPIAKIENATYAEIAAALGITETQLLAYNDSNLSTIETLRANLPKAMTTTFVYKPLVGISSVTDPKGYKTTYEYDSFNRLKLVKDNDGNILKSNKYNYKQ